jgi:hypothetical protein
MTGPRATNPIPRRIAVINARDVTLPNTPAITAMNTKEIPDRPHGAVRTTREMIVGCLDDE